VLNSLIFPFHEQHHNNSFLCAALVEGQSNMAAGATIGSNHNSRSADGELQAGRGFWPGLCVSLKHNSRFASFTIISKGDFPAELNISLPFSLVSNDVANDRLVVMPAYWFQYNLYALTRNEWKYGSRDARKNKHQQLEISYLAPDTVNEMFDALAMLEYWTGKAALPKEKNELALRNKGREMLLNEDPALESLEILADGFENSDRKVLLLKVQKAYTLYIRMIRFYGIRQLVESLNVKDPAKMIPSLASRAKRKAWVNLGGQLVQEEDFNRFRASIHNGRIKNWQDVHSFYKKQAELYPAHLFGHACAALREINAISSKPTRQDIAGLLKEAVATFEWINQGIIDSRKKDYENPFRKMVYEDEKEMDKVIGSLEDNGFIRFKQEELATFTRLVKKIITGLK
jgi:hypothetical protein